MHRPTVLMFDEPINGLDPEASSGCASSSRRWLARDAPCSSRAAPSEIAQVAAQLIVIGNGRIIAEGSIADVVSRRAPSVFVRAERQSEFARQLASRGAVVDGTPGGG